MHRGLSGKALGCATSDASPKRDTPLVHVITDCQMRVLLELDGPGSLLLSAA